MSRQKGLSLVRQKNKLKKEYLGPLRKYAEQLEAENYALKNDPNTVIGQFIGNYRELYGQNQRLSVLAACLIKKLDDKVVLTREEMEQFKTKLINIKWEIADGETTETAKEFVFTYELQDAPPQGQPVVKTEEPNAELGYCDDPECALNKAQTRHRHTPMAGEELDQVQGEVVEEAVVATDQSE
jgi:hypothetical protein